MLVPALNPGQLMYLRNSQLKGRSLGKILHWLRFWKKPESTTKKRGKKILADGGSVQDIKELDEDTKEVFKTFKEINQLELVDKQE